MDFSMGDKTLVKHFLSLTETVLTTKQARQAADFLKELVMSDFLEALEKAEDKLEFLNKEPSRWFWLDKDYSYNNWFYNYDRINDNIILEKWGLVLNELKIKGTQKIILQNKDYATYLDFICLKRDFIKIIEPTTERRVDQTWKWLGVIRGFSIFKKALTNKNGFLEQNSEFSKKMELKKESDKIIIAVKRDKKILDKLIKKILKTEKNSEFLLSGYQKNAREKHILTVDHSVLTIIRLIEMRF